MDTERIRASSLDSIEHQLHESTLPLLEAIQSQLADLRSYGPDKIQELVSSFLGRPISLDAYKAKLAKDQ